MVRSLFSSRESRIVRHDAKLRIVDRDATLEGTPCLIIESRPDNPSPLINRYWVDIARRGLILKHVESVSGRITAEMTISYKNETLNGWLPASWHGRFLNRSLRSSVIDFTVNEQFAADMFEIAYPVGTVVFDQDRSKQWRILAGGTKELITPEDRRE